MVKEFILNNEYKCQYDPIGWDEFDKTLIRNNDYLGIFRQYTAELEFIKDDLKYIHTIYEREGTEAVLPIKVLRQKDYKDEQIVEFEGIAKLNPYSIEYKDSQGSLTPYVKLKFEDSSLHNKIITRDDQKVNLGSDTTIEGVALSPLTQRDVILHQRKILAVADFELDELNKEIDSLNSGLNISGGHNIPVNIVQNEVPYSQTPYSLEFNNADGCFINQTETLQVLQIKATGKFLMSNFTPGGGNVDVFVVLFTYDETFSSFTVESILHQQTLIFQQITDVEFNINTIVTLSPGKSIAYALYLPTPTNYQTEYEYVTLEVVSDETFDNITAKCTLRHEALERLTQIITDDLDSFKSDVFGRTDIGYSQNGTYSNNGIISGKEIRLFDDKPEISLKDTLKSLRGIFNVGMGIEKIDRKYKVVIEEIDYFFQGTVGLTIHNATNIKKSVWSNGTYANVKSGYASSELEITNGLEEYNNQTEHSTFIKSQKGTLDLVSTERADGYGIEKLRRKNKKIAATEDLKEDKNNWILMVDLNTSPLQCKKDEDFESVQNIFSEGTAYNLDITPQRNLLRNSDWLNASLLKYSSEITKFISSDRTTDLITKKVGESEVREQSDINNTDLLDPLWHNEIYDFECVLDADDFDKMEANPYYLVKFSPYSKENALRYEYGWILEAKGGGEGRKGTMKLLRANLNSNRLRLIDPEGIAPAPPGSTPVPPALTDGGFESPFEFIFVS